MKSNTAAFFAETYGSDMPRITFISSPNRDARGSIIPDVIAQAKPKDFTVRRLLRQAEREGAELFFAPVPMSGEGMPSEAQAKDAAVIWADVDQDFTDEQWALIERLDATVNESGGVGRHHVFVPLDVPHPPHVIKQLNQALRVALDGDAKQNPASFLRVPGSFNRKGEPVLCRTVRLSSSRQTLPNVRQALRTDASSASEYQRASVAVEDAVSAAETFRKYAGKTAPGLGGMSPRRLLDKANGRFEEGNYDGRHKLASGLTKDLLRIGLSQGEALGVLLECDAATDKWTPAQIAADVARVYSKEVPHQPDSGAESRGQSTSAGVSAEPGVTSADDGGDVTEVEDAPKTRKRVRERGPKRKSRFLTRQELSERPEPKWLIERLLPEYGIGQLFGPTYGGKTYAAIDLVMRITTGMGHWIGHTITMHGPVFYVLMEGGFDFGKRLDAWEMKYGRTSDELYVMVEEELNLADVDSLDQLADDITAVSSTPRLLVIDTQSLAISGVEENDNTGMNEVMQKLKRLSKALGCFVLLVHHTGHANEDRGRGASAQPAALDTIIRVNGSEKNGRKIAVPKVKAGREIRDRDFRLEEQKNGWPVFVELSVGEVLERDISDEDRIIRYLKHNGPLGASEVAEALEMAESTCRRKCGDMTNPEKCEGGKPSLVVVGATKTRKNLYDVTDHLRSADRPDPADL